MKYEFPHITNISQVLPVIEGLPEFVVAVKDGGYTVINYNVAFDTTFPPITSEADAIRRECRELKLAGNELRTRFSALIAQHDSHNLYAPNYRFGSLHGCLLGITK